MKIALVRRKYNPFGGAELYMARLIGEFAAEGHEVHILSAQWEAEVDGIRLHRVPVLRGAGWLKSLSFCLGCKKIIAREGFDIVFSLERTLRQDVYRAGDGCHRSWLRQKNLGRGLLPRLATYLDPIQLAYLLLERRLFTDPQLSAIIANSRMGKREIMELYGVPSEKIQVVYNGIDAAAFPLEKREEYRQRLAEEYRIGDGELRILYVGSGFRRKGVPALIEAAARLRIPFRLFVVGKGRSGYLKRRARSLGIEGRVHFTGPLRDVERFYLGCDLFAFPTLYDPFSNATLEAMACRLPVVTTPFNGVAELFAEGEQGFVLPDPLDAGAIAAAIEKLADPAERHRMGARAAETVAALTIQRNSLETLSVIRGILEQKRKDQK